MQIVFLKNTVYTFEFKSNNECIWTYTYVQLQFENIYIQIELRL